MNKFILVKGSIYQSVKTTYQILFDCIRGSKEPQTVVQLYKKTRCINRSNIYDYLSRLANDGIVTELINRNGTKSYIFNRKQNEL